MASSFLLFDSPEYWHFLLAFYISVFLYFARHNLEIFFNLAVWFMGVGPQLSDVDILRRIAMGTFGPLVALHKKIMKCEESLWKITYYIITEIWFLSVVYHESWFTDAQKWIKGWPNHKLTFPLSAYYMFQCAFYMYSIASLRFWENRRKDFKVMMAHHIVAAILIAGSYITGFFRIGSIILGLHDASDILMEAAKIFKYSNKQLGASIFFGLFALSWAILRLVIFPFHIIKLTSYDFLRYVDVSKGYKKMLYYVFNMMLLTLLLFHVYWWKFISLMIVKQLRNRGRVGEDIVLIQMMIDDD